MSPNPVLPRAVPRALVRSASTCAILATLAIAGPHQATAAPGSGGTDSVPGEAKRVAPAVTIKPLAPKWVLPVSGYRLTGTFGASSALWSSTHTGLDFAAPEGTPIVAVASGEVIEAGYDGAYGNKVVLQLGDGTELWFCHQSSIEVSVGDQLAAGDPLGHVGSTGNVTGAHLHLEVRPTPDEPVDPYTELTEHGLQP